MKFSEIEQFIGAGGYQINMPIARIPKWLEDMKNEIGLELNPDFQRGHVWTKAQQSAYIEFLLRGGESGRIIYFNCPSWMGRGDKDYPLQCVDGLQRLTAVTRFLNNKIKAFGHLLREYDGDIPTRIDLLFNINSLQTRAEVLKWYLEFNSGGTVHSEAELNKVRSLLLAETHDEKPSDNEVFTLEDVMNLLISDGFVFESFARYLIDEHECVQHGEMTERFVNLLHDAGYDIICTNPIDLRFIVRPIGGGLAWMSKTDIRKTL